MAISLVSFLRCSLRSFLPLTISGTQPFLIHPLSTQPPLIPFPNAVRLPSLSLPSRPTRRTLAASSDDGPIETAVGKLKEWSDSVGRQPSHLPTSTAWWKKRARKWLDGFETGFCLCLAVLLFRMGYHALYVTMILCGLMKLYFNIKADYREIETQDTIDRIAYMVHALWMECQPDKQRSEVMEKRCLDENNGKEPTRRAIGPILATSSDGDLQETMTTVNKLKEWWYSLSQQPSHLPTTTEWWKTMARKWLGQFETGFCLCLVFQLFRMGNHELFVALIVGGLMKFYLNVKAEYKEIETQDTIDRIAHRIRLLMECQQGKQILVAVEKSNGEVMN